MKITIEHFRAISRTCLKEYSSVPHRPPQFNTSVPHKDHTFSAPKIRQFTTKNHSVPHQNLLRSTPKTTQFNTETPSVLYQKRPVQHQNPLSPTLSEGCVELRVF